MDTQNRPGRQPVTSAGAVFARLLGILANLLLLSWLGLRIWATVTVPDVDSEVLLLRVGVFSAIGIVCLALLVALLCLTKRTTLWSLLSIAWLFLGVALSGLWG